MCKRRKYRFLSTTCQYSKGRISIENVTNENYISTENMKPDKGGICTAYTIPNAKSLLSYSPNNILLSNIRPYFKKIWFADRVGGCSNDVLVLNVNQDFNAKFLYYVLSDNNFFNYSNITSKGTKMPRGSKHAIMKYLVPDVDASTQVRIATILSTYDDLIENNNRRIALLEQAAQELYKEWFMRFRFPEHENTKFENGLPVGWEYGRLSEIMSFGAGKERPKSGSLFPVYGGNGILDYCDFYNNENVIIIGRVGAYCGSVYYEPMKCWISDNALYAVSKRDTRYFDYYLLKHMHLNTRHIGTGQPLITQGLLNRLKTIIPPRKLVGQFDGIVAKLLAQHSSLQQMNRNLSSQRDLLLPRFMSGKLEVMP